MTLFIYILLGLLIVALELPRRFKGRPFDAMTLFNCYYFVLYVFVPINVMYLGIDAVRQEYAYDRFGYGDEYTALSLLLSYALFCLGYWLTGVSNRKSSARGTADHFSLRNSAYVAEFIFLLGVLTTLIYVVQIGGLTEVISRAGEVRSGELVIQSEFIFYRQFSQFSADAFVLFVAVLIGKRAERTRIVTADKAFLLCALVFFVYYALSTGGRRTFIYPVLACYLVYLSMGGKGLKVAVLLGALVFVVAGLGTALGAVALVGDWRSVFELAYPGASDWTELIAIAYGTAVQGLADSFVHFVGAQNAGLWQFGFLTDLVNLPTDLLPSQLLGFDRSRHMFGETTEFFLGRKLEEGFSGEENLGLHGYLLVNFGYSGMFVLFFVLGSLYKWLHARCRPADPKDAVGWLVYWWVILGFFVYFREGVLMFVLKQQLTWWMIIALLLYAARKRGADPKRKYLHAQG